MTPSLHVVIPVYNEQQNLPRLLAALSELTTRVSSEFAVKLLLVDDGSSDDTVAMARGHAGAPELVVLRHDINRGPGAAFGTAFEHLQTRIADGDWVATMEGDNTSAIDTLLHMLTRRKEGYEAVLASPYAYGGGFSHVHAHRLALSHIANGLVKLVFGIRGIHTFSSFFRLYSAELLRRLQAAYGARVLASPGFECMVELLAKMIQVGARVSEVEQTVDWRVREGPPKMRIGRTVKGYLRLFAMRAQMVPGQKGR